MIVQMGGISPLVKIVQHSKGTVRLPAILALTTIATKNEQLATSVIQSGVVPFLVDVIINEAQNFMKTAAAGCLGAIGHHSKELSDQLAEQPNDVLNVLLVLLLEGDPKDENDKPKIDAETAAKARSALKKLLVKVEVIEPLTNMLINAEGNRICKYIC